MKFKMNYIRNPIFLFCFARQKKVESKAKKGNLINKECLNLRVTRLI